MAKHPRISRTCEVIESWNHDKGPDKQTFCGKPAAYWYPAAGCQTMALCDEHAQKHLAYATQIGMETVSASAPPEPSA